VLGATYVYTYDNGGNILSKKTYPYTTGTLPATATDTVTYGYDSAMGDLLTSYDGQTIPYDTNSLEPERWKTSVNTWILYWSQGRRLNSMTAPNLDSLGFLYNADGVRTSKTYMPSNQAWITHTYTLSGSTILTEEWTENNVDHTILYLYDANGAPLGMRYTNSTKAGTFENYLFVTNLQGDIIHIYDDAGTRLVTYNYDAWGNHTVSYENNGNTTAARYNPFRYRGYYYDVETGLYYLNSRYYDPQVGRFISADSYVSTGQGLLGNNMFAYCLNDPVNRKDAFGNLPSWITDAKKWVGNKWNELCVIADKASDIVFTKDFAKHTWNSIKMNTNASAGAGFGIGTSADVGPASVELMSRVDVASIQFVDGKFRFGNVGRSSLSVGLFDLITVGPQSDTFEDHLTGNNIEPEDHQYWYDFGPSWGWGAGLGFAAHIEISLDIEGVGKDLYAYIKERW